MGSRLALGISAVLLFAGAVVNAAPARPARVGWSKMLFVQPNASAPAQLLAGLDAEVLQQYDDFFLAYVANGAIESAKGRGRDAGIANVVRDEYDVLQLPGGNIDARIGFANSLPHRAESSLPAGGETGLWLVQFTGPVLQRWQQSVRDLGVTPVQYIPYNGFVVAATVDQMRVLEQLPFIQFVDVYHASVKSDSVPRTDSRQNVIINLADAPGLESAIEEIKALSDGEVVRWRAGAYVEVFARLDRAGSDAVIQHPLVVAISLDSGLQVSDERVAMSMTNNVDANGIPIQPKKYKGWLAEACPFCGQLWTDGFWAGTADTGLDGGTTGTHHPDLPYVPPYRIEYGKNFADTDSTLKDTTGHGTMVAGTIAGDPAPSAGSDADGFFWGTGIAPTAGIFVTRILTQCPADNPCPRQGDIFRYAADARNLDPGRPGKRLLYLQNYSQNQYRTAPANAFGCIPAMDGKYSQIARDFDVAVSDANGDPSDGLQPITLTASAGNNTQQPTPPRSSLCWSDNRLTLPPATAKNVIAVGGAENKRGPTEERSCMGARSDSYSNIMGWSKRGTITIQGAQFQRFKPDLMAPSSGIVSLKSAAALNVAAQFCAAFPYTDTNNPNRPTISGYYASTGTSFAAPVGAGAALLAARVYAERVTPGCSQTANCNASAASPALVKAMLIAGARSMRGGQDNAMGDPWVKQTGYEAGDIVRPTQPNGFVYRAIVGGLSGGVEPTWTLTGTVEPFDNQVQWTMHSATELTAPAPNNRQGFGRINLENVLSAYPAKWYSNEALAVQNVGSSHVLGPFVVHNDTEATKIVLTWTDPVGQIDEATSTWSATGINPLMNKLHLTVDVGSPCAKRYIGNQMTVVSGNEQSTEYTCSQGVGLYDDTNNAQMVSFKASAGTTFTITVSLAEGPGNQSFAAVVSNAYHSSETPPPGQPSGFSATARDSSTVDVHWNSSSGAVSYEVRRKSLGGMYETINRTTTTSFTDSGLAANTTYVYEVRAIGAAPNRFASAYTVPDVATTVVFSDEPLLPQTTTIRKAHIDELRTATNAVRAAAGKPPFAFADPSIDIGVTAVRVVHVTDLRDALADALQALGIPISTYSHPTINAGDMISAVDFQELRNVLK